MHFKRNNINKINTGQKVWQRVKKLSVNYVIFKNPDLFLPNKWPAYFKKQKDVRFGI